MPESLSSDARMALMSEESDAAAAMSFGALLEPGECSERGRSGRHGVRTSASCSYGGKSRPHFLASLIIWRLRLRMIGAGSTEAPSSHGSGDVPGPRWLRTLGALFRHTWSIDCSQCTNITDW